MQLDQPVHRVLKEIPARLDLPDLLETLVLLVLQVQRDRKACKETWVLQVQPDQRDQLVQPQQLLDQPAQPDQRVQLAQVTQGSPRQLHLQLVLALGFSHSTPQRAHLSLVLGFELQTPQRLPTTWKALSRCRAQP